METVEAEKPTKLSTDFRVGDHVRVVKEPWGVANAKGDETMETKCMVGETVMVTTGPEKYTGTIIAIDFEDQGWGEYPLYTVAGDGGEEEFIAIDQELTPIA